MENYEWPPTTHNASPQSQTSVVPGVNEEELSNTTAPIRGPSRVTTAEDFHLDDGVQSGLGSLRMYLSPFYIPSISPHLADLETLSSGNEQEILSETTSSPFPLMDNASMPLVQGSVDESLPSTWPSAPESLSLLLARHNEIMNTMVNEQAPSESGEILNPSIIPFMPSLGDDYLGSFPLNIDQTQSHEYMCRHPICNGRVFTRRGDLYRHERIHQMQRPYPCNWIGCNRTGQNGFTRRDKLAEHERNVHGIDRRAINGVWF
ncbi:hypothetical protein BGW36DRAFT_423455 [Talaromyces proteolyticus]|uniref:C2H2-type domain-containing protein n=1 Tax=Talaromyces proteolyticus TaxID=1131652 RepID=A0AAD4L3G0_9EURO|nr:uncharacterized protein BGW36DRAFT_423455 [Talaromyces proteolyticus]KAH8703914.1 hypothetical protein BGW36DRAFT_423455 [Talaromyces proteolyticus]